MKSVITSAVRFLQGLRRPSKAANVRRLRERGESLGSLVIREAMFGDVASLAHLHVVTFNATHGLPFGRRPTRGLRERQWKAKLEGSDEGLFCFVAENAHGDLVGFASGGPYDHADQPVFAGQLNKIYILPEYQRLGLGRRLVGHVTRRLLQQDITSMLLFSQAENPSCAFFDALGGERLLSESGDFHGAFGWRDLERLATLCPAEQVDA